MFVDVLIQLLQVDVNGDGYVQTQELQAALKEVGIDLPGYTIRELVKPYGGKDRLTFSEFSEVWCYYHKLVNTLLFQLYVQLKTEKDKRTDGWTKSIKEPTERIYQVGNTGTAGADEIVHSIRVEEEVAFASWINSNLSSDADLKRLVPVKEGGDLYNKIQDGLVIWYVIDLSL